MYGGLNGGDVPGVKASQRRQRAQFHHRASIPPAVSQKRQAYLFRRAYPPCHQAEGSRAGGAKLHFFALLGGSGWTCVQPYDYWSGTEYAPNLDNAWNFNTNDGNQNNDDKQNELLAMAVRPGG